MKSRSLFGSIVLGVACLFGLTIFFGSWFTMDESERGVVLRNGAITKMATPGLNFKFPVVDDVVIFSLRPKVLSWEKIQAYSGDQQPADIKMSVNYIISPDKVEALYREYSNDDQIVGRLIAPRAIKAIKDVFGTFTAPSAIRERARLNLETSKYLSEIIEREGHGLVTISGVQIENIDFSDTYEKTVEERMTAEVEVAKIEQVRQQEEKKKAIAILQAEGRAQSTLAEAKAKADAIKLQGEAEAAAIAARGRALKENPGMPQLVIAERWNGTLPQFMVPNGTLPLMNMPTPQVTPPN